MSDIAHKPKFQLLPDLQRHEIDELAESIRRFGVKLPVVIDEDGNILDGHHRVMIADSLGVEYPKQIETGLSVEEKRILAAQLNAARRHMTDAQRVQLGRQIEPDIESVARLRSEANLRKGNEAPSGSPDPLGEPIGRTRDEVARTVGLGSGITYERNKQVLEDFEEVAPERVDDLNAGTIDMPEARQIVEEKKQPHVSHNSGENEWYTPAEYIEAAREVLGTIDLDPASSDVANERVKATSYFTKDDNGLAHEWHGNVWMNPPYAQPLISSFAEKVVEEFDAARINAAIVLVNNATDTKWFRTMEAVSPAICFTPRIRFIDPDGNPSGAPLQGQAILYMGDDPDLFARVFRQFGFVRGVI